MSNLKSYFAILVDFRFNNRLIGKSEFILMDNYPVTISQAFMDTCLYSKKSLFLNYPACLAWFWTILYKQILGIKFLPKIRCFAVWKLNEMYLHSIQKYLNYFQFENAYHVPEKWPWTKLPVRSAWEIT